MWWKLGMILAALAAVGCVKIQVQPESGERKTEAAGLQGKDFRVTFADRLRGVTPVQKLDMTRTLIDSVTANYLRYGANVADQWRQGTAGRGQAVSDAEMRDLVARSNVTQEPLTQAYEESIDYGIEQIKRSQGVDPTLLQQLSSYRDHFYTVYNAVFYPKGTVADYEGRLASLKAEGEQMSQKLSDGLRMLR